MRATYLALWVVSTVVAKLPRRARELFGVALGVLAGSVLRIRRTAVEDAMADAGVDAPAIAANAMYRNLGRGLVELLHLAGARPAEREAAIADVSIDTAAEQALTAGLARGPVMFFASHTGNWELAAAAAARLLEARGKRLGVIAKAMSVRGVDAFLARLRNRLGVDVVSPTGAFAAARRALRQGNVVVMPIDQVPDRENHALPVSFLRRPAFADRAPATLAWRAKATVLVVAAEYTAGGHRVRLLETIAPPAANASSRRWIDETTLRATAALERFVCASPPAWMWLHRRWRAPRRPRLVATAQPG